MTELELYKFIQDNKVEWHRRDNCGTPDIIMFPHIAEIEDFHKILSPSIFDDEGIECTMKDGYFAFWMNDICDYYGIDIDKVFVGESGNS